MAISLYRMISTKTPRSVFVNSVPCMNVISHALEDALLAREEPATLYAGFQRFSHFLHQEQRYRQLAKAGVHVYVWGVADVSPPVISGVEYISLAPSDSLARQWFLMIDSPSFWSALLSAETTYGEERAASERRFEGLWSYDAEIVEGVYLLLSRARGQGHAPMTTRDYASQGRTIALITSRLVRHQDRLAAQAPLDQHHAALLQIEQMLSLAPDMAGQPQLQRLLLGQIQTKVGELRAQLKHAALYASGA